MVAMTKVEEEEFKRVLQKAVKDWGWIKSGYFYNMQVQDIRYGDKNEFVITATIHW